MHQITLLLCDNCLHEYQAGKTVALIRRSHRWSFWCEHTVTEDWYPGHQAPLGIRIGLP